MFKAEIARQLMIRGKDEIGMLFRVTTILATAEINILAICAYAVENMVAMMFVTNDNNGAKTLLEEHDYDIQEEEVVMLTLDNQPGALQAVTHKIAQAGIDLRLIYGSVDPGAENAHIVLISKNNLDVVMIVKTEMERG